MKLPLRNKIEDVITCSGVSREVIVYYVQESWVSPIDPRELIFDEEDIARIKLIHELRRDLGVNDESIPIILHLIDQLNYLNLKLREDDNG
jgi:chaperone modulatory protein CbpM